MGKPNVRGELTLLLKSRSKHIVKLWSDIVFKSTTYQKERAASKSVRIAGMAIFLRAFIADIEKRFVNLCSDVIEKLVFKDYLSASSADEVIREITTLRTVISAVIEKEYKGNIQKIIAAKDIVLNEIDKNIICFSSIYKRRDFTRLETIMQYGKKLIAIHDLDRLCDLILEAAVIESNSDRASLMLLDEDGYLRIKSSIGIPKKIAAKSKQKVGHGIAGTVAETKEPIIISEGFKITKKSKRSLRGLGLESAISVPLLSEHTVLGVLNLGKRYNRPFFDKDDAELLLILAHEAGAAISNCKLFDEVHELYEGSIVSLAAAVDARDHYTQGHSNKVANIAVSVAEKLNLPVDTIEKIKLASMLHDIGKIGIPDKILHKPGKLTDEEFDIIKQHPAHAVSILRHIPRLRDIIPIIYHEHERFDGKGYCCGLKGSEIPIESRLIAIADAYDAMTSNRPYRKAMSKKKAIEEIKRNSGTQFDPALVKIFLKEIQKT